MFRMGIDPARRYAVAAEVRYPATGEIALMALDTYSSLEELEAGYAAYSDFARQHKRTKPKKLEISDGKEYTIIDTSPSTLGKV